MSDGQVIYRIRDWNECFENNRTRDIKSLAFVLVPNKLDGDGFTELIDHAAGAAHYGAWVTIALVASKCRPRGTLVRDGGKPHDCRSLSRITRIPSSVYEEAIPRLVAIGWLESLPYITQALATTPQEGAGLPQEGAGLPHSFRGSRARAERNGTERNEVEQNRTDGPSVGGGARPSDSFGWDEIEHFDWEAVRREAGTLAAAVTLRPGNGQDGIRNRKLALTTAALIVAGDLPPESLTQAIAAFHDGNGRQKDAPWAYLKGCLRNFCDGAGVDLNAALDRCPIPENLLRPKGGPVQ